MFSCFNTCLGLVQLLLHVSSIAEQGAFTMNASATCLSLVDPLQVVGMINKLIQNTILRSSETRVEHDRFA